MLIDGKKLKSFSLSDLNSRVSFTKWIIENIENERSSTHLNIFSSKRYLEYLNYIEDQMKKQPLKNKIDWIERIKILREDKEKRNEV